MRLTCPKCKSDKIMVEVEYGFYGRNNLKFRLNEAGKDVVVEGTEFTIKEEEKSFLCFYCENCKNKFSGHKAKIMLDDKRVPVDAFVLKLGQAVGYIPKIKALLHYIPEKEREAKEAKREEERRAESFKDQQYKFLLKFLPECRIDLNDIFGYGKLMSDYSGEEALEEIKKFLKEEIEKGRLTRDKIFKEAAPGLYLYFYSTEINKRWQERRDKASDIWGYSYPLYASKSEKEKMTPEEAELLQEWDKKRDKRKEDLKNKLFLSFLIGKKERERLREEIISYYLEVHTKYTRDDFPADLSDGELYEVVEFEHYYTSPADFCTKE